jgi:hypothetical protein
MRRDKFPAHWPQGAVKRLEANPLWREYAVTHPTKSGSRDLDDIRSFAETIMCDECISKPA